MKAIYYDIYKDLRDKIIEGVYPYQSYIPSELKLIDQYECTHNTLRKALVVLQMHGFVQPIRGKGVKVIWLAGRRTQFVLGDIENMREAFSRLTPTSAPRICAPRSELASGPAEVSGTSAKTTRATLPVLSARSSSCAKYALAARGCDELMLTRYVSLA